MKRDEVIKVGDRGIHIFASTLVCQGHCPVLGYIHESSTVMQTALTTSKG